MNIVMRDAMSHPVGLLGHLMDQLSAGSITLVCPLPEGNEDFMLALARHAYSRRQYTVFAVAPDWQAPPLIDIPQLTVTRDPLTSENVRVTAQMAKLIVLDAKRGNAENSLYFFLEKQRWDGAIVPPEGLYAHNFTGTLTVQEWTGEADLRPGPPYDPPLVHIGQRVFVGGSAACDHYGRKFPLRIHIRRPKETGDCLQVLALKPTWGDTVIEAAVGVPFSERDLRIAAARARQPGDLFVHCETGTDARELAAWCCSQRLKK